MSMEINFKEFIEKINEARILAVKEGIVANAILINPNMVKVPQCWVTTNSPKSVIGLPPMICGLEIHVSDTLPNNYTFAITEFPSEREFIKEQERDNTARKIIKEFEQKIKDLKKEYNIGFRGDDYEE